MLSLSCTSERKPIDKYDATSSRFLLIDQKDQTYSFGTVISNGPQTLTHDFVIINNTSAPISELSVVNGRPCCGTVSVQKTTLEPGEQTSVRVAITLNRQFGLIQHVSELRSENSLSNPILLTTEVHVVPKVSIQEKSIGANDNSHLLQLEVKVAKQITESVVDTENLEIRSKLITRWLGEKSVASEHGLLTETRMLSITLPTDGLPGDYSESLTILSGEQILKEHTIHWTVQPEIVITPKSMGVRVGESRQVLVRSPKGLRFKLSRAQITSESLTLKCDNMSYQQSHLIDLRCDQNISDKKTITFEIEMESGRIIECSILVLSI